MPLITQGKTNYLYVLFVAAIAIIVGGFILGYYYFWIIEIEARLAELEAQLPVVKQSKDETANTSTGSVQAWKTYRNEEYGFEIKYPEEWFADPKYSTKAQPLLEQKSVGAISSSKDFLQTRDDAFVIVFNIYEKVDYITLDDFILTYKAADSGEFFYPDIAKEGKKTFKAGGKDAIWLQGNLGPAVKHIEVFIPEDETRVIVVEGWDTSSQPVQEKYVNLLNQILSTFKFIEDTREFCGWSTEGSCVSDANCKTEGCSGQVCQSKNEEGVITTCEMKDCYNQEQFDFSCKCVESKCQWSK